MPVPGHPWPGLRGQPDPAHVPGSHFRPDTACRRVRHPGLLGDALISSTRRQGVRTGENRYNRAAPVAVAAQGLLIVGGPWPWSAGQTTTGCAIVHGQ